MPAKKPKDNHEEIIELLESDDDMNAMTQFSPSFLRTSLNSGSNHVSINEHSIVTEPGGVPFSNSSRNNEGLIGTPMIQDLRPTVAALKDRIRAMLQYEGMREHLIDEVFCFMNSLQLSGEEEEQRKNLNELRIATEESFPVLPPLKLNDSTEEVYYSQETFSEMTAITNSVNQNSNEVLVVSTDSRNRRVACQVDSSNPFAHLTRDDFEKIDFHWNTKMMSKLLSFGIRQFRPNQRSAINASIAGRDLFVLMPTGGGKSLIYQLPAICGKGLTFVISPLLSLIQDQVEALTSIGIPSINIAAVKNMRKVMKSIGEKTLKGTHIIYVTPEKITASKSFLDWMIELHEDGRIDRFVIDEAHLVTTWGHSFRQSFREMKLLRDEFPSVPISALTATATPKAQEDIVKTLGLYNPICIKSSFNRTNLIYEVYSKKEKMLENMKAIIDKYPDGSGIIYCLSKKDTEKMAEKIKSLGYTAGVYHSEYEKKEKVHSLWREGKIRIICATVAFGMGIDKANVRFVIHHSIPKSIEDYYQESGRAGRDGKQSHCVIFYSRSDRSRVLQLQDQPGAGEKIQAMVDYCENKIDCRRVLQLRQFHEAFDAKDCKGLCDNCQSKENYEEISVDVTKHVRNLLSLIKEGGKLTLASYLAKVYHGSKAKDIASKWRSLKEYGQGDSLKIQEIDDIVNEMLKRGLINERRKRGSHGQSFGILSCSASGNQFLSNRSKTFSITSHKIKVSKILKHVTTNDSAVQLLKILNTWRDKKASEKEISAQLVISDVPLQEISEKLPITLLELENINGMAPPLLAEFGFELIQIVRKFRKSKLNDGTETLTKEEKAALKKSLSKYQSKNKAKTLLKLLEASTSETVDTESRNEEDRFVMDLTAESDEEEATPISRKRKRDDNTTSNHSKSNGNPTAADDSFITPLKGRRKVLSINTSGWETAPDVSETRDQPLHAGSTTGTLGTMTPTSANSYHSLISNHTSSSHSLQSNSQFSPQDSPSYITEDDSSFETVNEVQYDLDDAIDYFDLDRSNNVVQNQDTECVGSRKRPRIME